MPSRPLASPRFSTQSRNLAVIALAVSCWLGTAEGKEWDLVVYGATPAGIIAAVSAAKEGASVVVLEPTAWIGGMVTGGLAKSDTGNPLTIGGLTREFFSRAASGYEPKWMWFAEPHVNMATFQAMLGEAKVEVLTNQRLQSVNSTAKRITSLATQDGSIFSAHEFIDATYEGDLMAGAGVSYIVGRESHAQYGEPLAGFDPMPIRPRTDEVMASDCACVGGKGPHYIHGTPTTLSGRDEHGKLLAGVQLASAEPGSADKLTQSYNFRIVVTKAPELRIPFPKPAQYDPSRYELLLHLIQAYPAIRFGRLFHLGQIANGKADLNAQGFFSTDYPGANTDYPDGNQATRERIWNDHINQIQGMLWFLGNDERVPKSLREETNQWGLCRDEFADNANWPYALYVREARRMIGEYVMVQKDCQNELNKPDSVAMGSFVIDCHIVQRIVRPDGSVTDEGSFQDAPARPYQIAYRSLTPKRAQCENLLVPVCLSASHIAYCSLRMEPVYMALGQASGLAAVQALRHHQAVQEIDVTALQTQLRAQAAVLELKGVAAGPSSSALSGLVVDDSHAEFTGNWIASAFGNPIDGSSSHDGDEGKGAKTARFSVKVPVAGLYEARLAYVAAPNRAEDVPVSIESADATQTVHVNQKLAPALDKQFVVLGRFHCTPDKPSVVTVSNAGTHGHVVVDAVQWVPVQ